MKYRTLALLILTLSAFGQTATYPSSVVTDQQLKVLKDRAQTALNAPLTASATTLSVVSSAKFAADMIVTIDSEQIAICAVGSGSITVGHSACPSLDGRGFNGTAAASHANNSVVSAYLVSWMHNAHSAEIKAIETALGPNLSNIQALIPALPPVTHGQRVAAVDYNFTPQAPGGSLSVGNNTVTLAPVPRGVNGTDIGHRLWVSGGAGTAEGCLIAGGTGVAGSNGQIILNCANAHSGNWTIQSASAGIREAAQAIGMAGEIWAQQGVLNIYATLVLPTTISLRGAGAGVNGSGVGTKLLCAATASPCIAIADGLGTADLQGIATHSGYMLHGPGSGRGVWIGGDPVGVFAPATWYGSYSRFEDVIVDNFSDALYYQNGNFVSFHRSVFSGLSRALLIPSTANYGGLGNQPIAFYDCVLTVPTGAAVQMDESGLDTTGLYFSGGQVSGTIIGTAVDWISNGTHYEPNSNDTPIVTLGTSTAIQQVRIFGGLMSTHGTSTPYHIGVSGSGFYNITVKDVYVQCNSGTTVPAFVSYATSTGGNLVLDNVFLAPAGTFTDLYTFTPSGGATPGLVVRQPRLTWAQGVTVAATLVFPPANFPVAGTLQIVGGTLSGSGITAVSGLKVGQSGTLFTTAPQTFTSGSTIGNTITTTTSVPYTYYFDGTKIWIH